MVFVLCPLSFICTGAGVKVVDAYLGGANVRAAFDSSLGQRGRECGPGQTTTCVTSLNEGWLSRWGVIAEPLRLAVRCWRHAYESLACD